MSALKKSFVGNLAGVLIAGLLVPLIASAAIRTPIVSGQDPTVVFKDGYFNLIQSDGCNLRLRRAHSLSGLATAANPVIWAAGCSNVWAPEIHWINNRWYVYYSKDVTPGVERGWVIESTGASPFGPYTDRGMLFNGFWNIDGTIFTNLSGQLYYVFSGGNTGGNQQLYIAAMNNPYTLSGTPQLLSTPDQPWERNGLVNEGPWAFNRNGQIFIVYSASGCWTDDYTLGLLKLTGPNVLNSSSWTKIGPVFVQKPGAYGPGHNSTVVDASGQWWNVYHANTLAGQGCGSFRNIRAQRIFWTSANMPDFGSPVPAGSLISEVPDFLAAHYRLIETAGTATSDSACGGTGMLRGGAAWNDPGVELNGTTAYVEGDAALGNDVQHTITLAAWMHPNAFADWAGLITKGSNASPYALQTWGDGSLRFTANWGSPPGALNEGSWNSKFKMTTGEWQHVAATYDGTTIRFYLNGELDANAPNATLKFGVLNEPLFIGADFPGGDEFFDGTIRDARVYGRTLSEGEIHTLAGVNTPPNLAVILDRELVAGQTLLFTNSATDLETPPQSVAFRFQNAPSGATLDPVSGLFQWRPTISQSPSDYLLSVVASDNGVPNLSSTQSFHVQVNRPIDPALDALSIDEHSIELHVTGDAGPDYILESTPNLKNPTWLPLGTNIMAAPPFNWSPTLTNETEQFFRVRLGP